MRIVLISCVAKKKSVPCKASEMYISPLFKKAFEYAKKQAPHKIYILSAKYGLLDIDTVIDPYNETLNTRNSHECKVWAENVVNSLRENCDLQNDEFIFFAGEKYRKHVISHINNYTVPLEGLPIGKQLQFYVNQQEGALDE